MPTFKEELDRKTESEQPVGDKRVYETYNKYKDVASGGATKAMTFIGKYSEQIISMIIAFLLIGIQQFAEPNFNPLFFFEPKFWYEYLPYVMSIWIIIFSTLTGNFKWLAEVHQVYVITRENIQSHVNLNREKPFIYVGAQLEDRDRRISAWKTKISNKIDRKRKKKRIASIDALRDFIDGDDKIVDYRIKAFTRARKQRLRAHFKSLFSQLEDDYIEKYYDTLKVKYNQVSETVLVSGLVPKGSFRSEPDFKEHLNTIVFDEFGLGFIVFSIFSAFILALDLSVKGASVSTWVTFVFKAFMLYTYFFRASARSKPIFEKTRLKALQERETTLNKVKRRVFSTNVIDNTE